MDLFLRRDMDFSFRKEATKPRDCGPWAFNGTRKMRQLQGGVDGGSVDPSLRPCGCRPFGVDTSTIRVIVPPLMRNTGGGDNECDRGPG